MASHRTGCEHEFERAWRSPFVETDGARACRLCARIEVLFDRRWVEFDEYLDLLRDEQRAAE